MRIFREKDSNELSTAGCLWIVILLVTALIATVVAGLYFGGYVAENTDILKHEAVPTALPTKQEVSGPSPICEVVKNDYDKSLLVLKDINSYRESKGLPPYELDPRLTYFASHKAYIYSQAKEWSHDMGGRTWTEIYQDCGTIEGWYGENLAKGFDTTGGLLQAWLDSPRHHEVLDNLAYKKVGIFAGDSTTDYYIVTLFSE